MGSGTECEVPVDECSAGSDDCHDNATCNDLDEGFECTCNEGFFGSGNECEAGKNWRYF